MSRKSMLLFVLVCALGGFGTFLGSILGNAFGKTGLYTGAIIGGTVGVAAATKIAVRRQILGPKRYWPATFGGVLGLLLAAIIATNNLSTPVVPLASILLIGLGAVFGASARHGKSIDR
jgi:peptidoglycan/LPS O-acetylase OafA/YrhL